MVPGPGRESQSERGDGLRPSRLGLGIEFCDEG
jgi:hypothetical protein